MPLPRAGCEGAFSELARGWSAGHGDRERLRRPIESNQMNLDRRTIS